MKRVLLLAVLAMVLPLAAQAELQPETIIEAAAEPQGYVTYPFGESLVLDLTSFFGACPAYLNDISDCETGDSSTTCPILGTPGICNPDGSPKPTPHPPEPKGFSCTDLEYQGTCDPSGCGDSCPYYRHKYTGQYFGQLACFEARHCL